MQGKAEKTYHAIIHTVSHSRVTFQSHWLEIASFIDFLF